MKNKKRKQVVILNSGFLDRAFKDVAKGTAVRVKLALRRAAEKIDHPSHYGGADNVYEAIKVIEAWDLNFSLGSAIKYISRAGKKSNESLIDDLKKARWYLDREIQNAERRRA